VLATRTNTTKQAITQGKVVVVNDGKMILYRRVEASELIINTNVKSITMRQSIIISRETPRFSLEVHVLAGMVVLVVSTNTTWVGG
jgi:hypothetical protein